MISYRNIISVLIASLLFCSLSVSSQAQTVQFSMDVQPELGIEVLQDLNFGTVIANSGKQEVSLGDAQMGIFKIKALAAQSAHLSLEMPDYLSINDSDAEGIPVTIKAAYSPIPTGYTDIMPFEKGSLNILLGSGNLSEQSPTWENGYIFIYGDINVEDIEQGSYSGTLVLNITYQ